MSEWDQVNQVMGYQHMLQSKRQRGAPLPADVEISDPSSWPYGDENGPPYTDPQDDQRRTGISNGDPIDMSQFTLGPREVLCQRCWLMHRAELACEEVW